MDKQNAPEQKFRRLKDTLGREMALFTICAYADIPYAMKTEADSWDDYLDTLQQGGIDLSAGFASGVTDPVLAARADMSQEERWEEIWGVGNPKEPYTDEDYRRLDYLFASYSARLVASGGYDEQQEYMLRSTCTNQLLAEKFRDTGTKEGIELYTKLNKTIQDNLGAENLRKKDILPQQEQRVDGFVDALKKKFGVDASLTYDDAVEACSKWLMSHKYPETRDAADHALLAIINCTRRNNDMPEMTELPAKYGFSADCCEFADEPNDMEREVYDYLELKRGEARGNKT